MRICKHWFYSDRTKAIKRHKNNLCPLIAPPPEGGEDLKKVTEPCFRQ